MRLPRRKKGSRDSSAPSNVASSTPAQQDAADIIEEVEAERDESGELVVSEDRIAQVGAVDAESVRENRRLADIVNKKRANIKNVPFNTGDLLTMYETVIKTWPPNTLDISVRRLTGSPVQQVITSRPRSSSELYEALKVIHGQSAEAEYEVKFLDTNRKEYRGTGRIVMPDARVPQQPGQPPMYYPNGVPMPPGYVPPQPQPQAAPAPMPVPAPVVVQPPPADMNGMIASMRQMFDMFQSMQQQMQQTAPQSVTIPSAPPPGADMPAMMAWMQQMFDMFRSMTPPAATAAAAAPNAPNARAAIPAQPPMPNPMSFAMGMPPIQPPPGQMWIPGFGFVPIEKLARALGSDPEPERVERTYERAPYRPAPPASAPPYRAGPYRPPYNPNAYDNGGAPPPYAPQPAPRPQTPAEQFREAIAVVRTAVDTIQEVNSILPGQMGGAAAEVEPAQVEDDSPVQMIDTGPAKIVVNKKDGSLRGWETAWANMDKVLKWVGEQREAIQRGAERQQQQQRSHQIQQQHPQQLPPGYVEVRPGFVPPPGYVAVPLEQLPPAPNPEHLPPSIQPTPAVPRSWGTPTIPFDSGDR